MDRLICIIVFFLSFCWISTEATEQVLVNIEVMKKIFHNPTDDYPNQLYVTVNTDEFMSDPITDLHLIQTKYEGLSKQCSSYVDTADTTSLFCVKKYFDQIYGIDGHFCRGGVNITIKPDLSQTSVDIERSKARHILSVHTSCDPTSSTKELMRDILQSGRQAQPFAETVNESTAKSATSRNKRSPTVYTIELLMVVDYAAYSWWLSLQKRGPNKADSTMLAIRQYYSYIFSGIDEKFRNIDKLPFTLDLAFVDIIVADTKAKSRWTETSLLENDADSERVMVNSSEALDKFQKWLDENTDLPKYDHAVLFTGTNLSYAGSPGNTGLAFAASMCRNISNSSIVEDAFDFRTVLFATQQISRSLGASDDMDNNDCLEFFNYIMAPKVKMPIKSFTTNRWKFSSCSEVYFTEYINGLNNQDMNCLAVNNFAEKIPTSMGELVNIIPGKVYSAQQQCQNKYGMRADICREEISKYKDLCGGFLCKHSKKEGCGYILPADGTPCGNKKYCSNGKCASFDDAEARSDECVFGNQPKMNCNRKVFKKPFLCYNDKTKNACCQSCEKVKIKGVADCDYGDRSESCSLRGCTQNDNTYVSKTCCLTCADGPTPFAPPLNFDFSSSQTPVSTTSTAPVIMVSGLVGGTRTTTSVAPTSVAVDTTFGETLPTEPSLPAVSGTTIAGSNTAATTVGSGLDISSITETFTTSQVLMVSHGPTTGPVPTTSAGLNGFGTSTSPANQFSSTGDPYPYTSTSYRGIYGFLTTTLALNVDPTIKSASNAVPSATKITPSGSTDCKSDLPPTTEKPSSSNEHDIKGFNTEDRMFFLDLANLMRDDQLRVKTDMHGALKRLYRYVTHQIRRFQDSDLEPLSFIDPLPPGSDAPSSDDDDLIRSLQPAWRHQYVDVINRLKKSIKRFRYRVLAFVKRFLENH